jgi:acetylornithine/N-succinyldiaminopimelate aminotransferase
MPGFVHVPYGDADALARAINERTAAVMVEPIQGEAGVVVPPSGYLHALRRLTQERGVLLIADEIQTGMARTGKMFGCEHENVVPDIMTLGKGIGAGIPLAALLARAAVSCFAPGDQGGTYSAHPLQSAVGLAVLRAMAAPGFLEHVVEAGDYLASRLRELANRQGLGEVRGAGLLWALNLGRPLSAAIVQTAFKGGLLINGPRPELLRFMPALTVTLAEIDELITRLQPAIAEAQDMAS